MDLIEHLVAFTHYIVADCNAARRRLPECTAHRDTTADFQIRTS
jgi:hypothetical protein